MRRFTRSNENTRQPRTGDEHLPESGAVGRTGAGRPSSRSARSRVGVAGCGTVAARSGTARSGTHIHVSADSAVLRTYGSDIARQVARERDLLAATSLAVL